MALMSLAAWLADTDGKTIGSGECVALANDYCARVLGVAPPATVGGAHDPYASSMWEGLPADSPFQKVSPLAPMRRGDLIIYRYGSVTAPLSHVAIGLNELGVALRMHSQNTNGHRYAETLSLPKAGIYGYLRLKGGAPVTDGQGGTGGTVLASDPVKDAVGAAGQLGALAGTWGVILDKLRDPDFWKRIGVGLLGIILIMVVLFKILTSSGALNAATGIVKKAM